MIVVERGVAEIVTDERVRRRLAVFLSTNCTYDEELGADSASNAEEDR
jgi:hypothetical protein